jgi:hypothetical protein
MMVHNESVFAIVVSKEVILSSIFGAFEAGKASTAA